MEGGKTQTGSQKGGWAGGGGSALLGKGEKCGRGARRKNKPCSGAASGPGLAETIENGAPYREINATAPHPVSDWPTGFQLRVFHVRLNQQAGLMYTVAGQYHTSTMCMKGRGGGCGLLVVLSVLS